MTVTTLTNSAIDLLLSTNRDSIIERDNLLESFFLNSGRSESLPLDFKMADLATYCYGDPYTNSYGKIRHFISKIQEDLSKSNKTFVEEQLAFIYLTGEDVKSACREIHASYVSGGAYLFTRKFLFMLLLNKSMNFRGFLREEGYDVPHSLSEKNARITNLFLTAQ